MHVGVGETRLVRTGKIKFQSSERCVRYMNLKPPYPYFVL